MPKIKSIITEQPNFNSTKYTILASEVQRILENSVSIEGRNWQEKKNDFLTKINAGATEWSILNNYLINDENPHYVRALLFALVETYQFQIKQLTTTESANIENTTQEIFASLKKAKTNLEKNNIGKTIEEVEKSLSSLLEIQGHMNQLPNMNQINEVLPGDFNQPLTTTECEKLSRDLNSYLPTNAQQQNSFVFDENLQSTQASEISVIDGDTWKSKGQSVIVSNRAPLLVHSFTNFQDRQSPSHPMTSLSSFQVDPIWKNNLF